MYFVDYGIKKITGSGSMDNTDPIINARGLYRVLGLFSKENVEYGNAQAPSRQRTVTG